MSVPNQEQAKQCHSQKSTEAIILDALHLLVQPGQVTELRVVDASTPAYRKTHTESGYFDYAHLTEMAKHAAKLTKCAQGTYITINPPNPALLARCANRIKIAATGVTTSDKDIIHRQWLYIDVDPIRPAKISATDDEKALARAVIELIRANLAARNWPAPIFTDSGNGYHLFYRVDLAVDDGGLIHRVLDVLAQQFNADGAKVDTSVFNPARIAKIPGTMARKGDDVPDRRHRTGYIIDAPAQLSIVPREMLEALTAEFKPPDEPFKGQGDAKPTTNGRVHGPRGRPNVERYLTRNGVAFRRKSEPGDRGQTIWVLTDGCVFDSSHNRADAAATQENGGPTDGKLGYHCFHNSCANRSWKDFVALVGRMQPEDFDDPPDGATPHKSKVGTGNVDFDLTNPAVNLTDLGNARRVVERHGANLRFCWPWKKWLVWDRRRWREDDSAEVNQRARETQSGLLRWALDKLAALADDPSEESQAEKGRLRKTIDHCLKWEDARRLNACVDVARSEPRIPILPEKLDSDPYLLNVLNGTIDLRTAALRDHRRADHMTKLAPVKYEQDAACPLWLRFLDRIMDGDNDLIEYLQRMVGYSLTGSVSEQALFFLYGQGANGKSVFLTTILEMLGDYAMQAPSELLMVRRHEGHPTERADLHARRFVCTIETDQGKRLAEAFTKQITGGDRIRARRMFENFWEFAPTFKIFLAANHKPVVVGQDHAMWRRIRLIPFSVTIPERDRDKHLLEKLRAERSGILRWAIDGCQAWQRTGLADPDAVRAATDTYRSEQDIIGAFLTECCVCGQEFRCRASALWERFRKWCDENGEHGIDTQRSFGQQLKSRGFESYTNNGTWYRGVATQSTE